MFAQNLSGQQLGQYVLHELLGFGGMGAVYRAEQSSLKRVVAVKILSTHVAADPTYVARFNREAQTAANLEHPHIVPIYDYGTDHNISYVVMRLLTGGTLAQRLNQRDKERRSLPSLGEVSLMLNQLAGALDYAHSQGVIHRDIKPTNIMFDNHGAAYIVDFGIAKLTASNTSLTEKSRVMGTPTYMSPEQWRGETLTPAADQYALAATIYIMLTGKAPFEGETPEALMYKHFNELPTPPSLLRSETPEAITAVLGRAMAKHSSQRYSSVAAFAEAFEKAVDTEKGQSTGFFDFKVHSEMSSAASSSSRNPGQTPKAKSIYRNPLTWLISLIMLLLFGLLAVIVIAIRQSSDVGFRQTQVALELTERFLTSGDTAAPPTPTTPLVVLVSTETPAPRLSDTQLPPEQPAPAEAATAVPTDTLPPTLTDTATLTHTSTPTLTDTTVPTDTATPTPTHSATSSPPPPTNTATDLPTSTPTDTYTPTRTPSLTASLSPTSIPTQTASYTASFTATSTPTPTYTDSRTPTQTASTTWTPTDTPTQTASYTPTRTATRTPSLTPSPLPTSEVERRAVLAFTPLTLNVGETGSIEAYVDCGSILCSVFDIQIEYDPTLLHVDRVGLGSYLGDSALVVQRSYEQAGTIRLSAVAQGALQPEASKPLFFITVTGVTPGMTQLTVTVLEIGDTERMVASVQGGGVHIMPAESLPTITVSRIPAPTATRTDTHTLTPTRTPTPRSTNTPSPEATLITWVFTTNVGGVKVHREPDVNSETVDFLLSNPARLLATRQVGSETWYYVDTGWRRGWLASWVVETGEGGWSGPIWGTPTPIPCTVYTGHFYALIHVGPGQEYAVRGTILLNAYKAVIGKAEASDGSIWWLIEYPGATSELDRYWVADSDVLKHGDCESVSDTQPS